MIRYVDAHCHLDLFPSYGQIAGEAVELDTAVIAVTTIPRAWQQNVELARPYPNVIPALGLHPQLVGSHASEIILFEELLAEVHFVGEVGLDATGRFYPFFDQQKMVFQRILNACVNAGNKVLTVHSVRTAKIVLDMLNESRIFDSDCKVILHWFTGGTKEAQRAIEYGCYFSVNVAMLGQPQHKQLLIDIPMDRILTESDGPFSQTPGGPQSPASMSEVVHALAQVRAQPAIEVRAAIVRNFERLASQ